MLAVLVLSLCALSGAAAAPADPAAALPVDALAGGASSHTSSSGSARQLAACNLVALTQPTAVPVLGVGASALVGGPCSGLNGYSFSARLRNPSRSDGSTADVAMYLGVGAAQCGARCVGRSRQGLRG